MKNLSLGMAALLALSAMSSQTLARTNRPVSGNDTTTIVVPGIHRTTAGTNTVVHDWNGVRYDVPSELLRAPGVLINGLSPQPLQFD